MGQRRPRAKQVTVDTAGFDGRLLDASDASSQAAWQATADRALARFVKTTEDLVALVAAAADGAVFELEEGIHNVAAVTLLISGKNDIAIRGPRGALLRGTNATLIQIQNSTGIRLEGFTVQPNAAGAQDAIVFDTSVTATVLRDLRVYRSAGVAIRGITALNTSITGLIIADCEFSGEIQAGILLDTSGGGQSQKIFIHGNNIVSALSTGHAVRIVGEQVQWLVVTANVMESWLTAVSIGGTLASPLVDVTIANNEISASGDHGIVFEQYVSRATICGNGIAGVGDYGVYVQTCSDGIISGNSIDGGVNGIRVVVASDMGISENVINETSGDGIYLDQVTMSICNSNRVIASGGFGILETAACDHMLYGVNHLRGNTGGPSSLSGTNSTEFGTHL